MARYKLCLFLPPPGLDAEHPPKGVHAPRLDGFVIAGVFSRAWTPDCAGRCPCRMQKLIDHPLDFTLAECVKMACDIAEK